jgi:hypothetical protein
MRIKVSNYLDSKAFLSSKIKNDEKYRHDKSIKEFTAFTERIKKTWSTHKVKKFKFFEENYQQFSPHRFQSQNKISTINSRSKYTLVSNTRGNKIIIGNNIK